MTELTKDQLEMIALNSYDDFSRYAAQKILDLYDQLAEKNAAIKLHDEAVGSYEHNRKLYQKENYELRKALEEVGNNIEDALSIGEARYHDLLMSPWEDLREARVKIEAALKGTGEGNE